MQQPDANNNADIKTSIDNLQFVKRYQLQNSGGIPSFSWPQRVATSPPWLGFTGWDFDAIFQINPLGFVNTKNTQITEGTKSQPVDQLGRFDFLWRAKRSQRVILTGWDLLQPIHLLISFTFMYYLALYHPAATIRYDWREAPAPNRDTSFHASGNIGIDWLGFWCPILGSTRWDL